MTKISEKDLYIFVFYQNQLSEEKVNYIKNNRSKFESELSLLEEIKENMAGDVESGIVERINSKIEKSNKPTTILLNKLVIENNDHLILAADSPEEEMKTRTDTFKDKGNKFLGKILTTDKMNRIYIFKNFREEIYNMTITLFPSRQSYTISSADLPLVVTPPQYIEQLELEF